jgi:hypothetical protein
MPTRRVRPTPRAFWLDSVLGHAVLTRSFKECNHSLSAESLVLLARGHVMDFELKRGFHFSSLAAQLFSAQGNPVGLVEALSVVNYTASSLGLPDARQGREDLVAVLEDGAAVARAAYGTDWEGALAVC